MLVNKIYSWLLCLPQKVLKEEVFQLYHGPRLGSDPKYRVVDLVDQLCVSLGILGEFLELGILLEGMVDVLIEDDRSGLGAL